VRLCRTVGVAFVSCALAVLVTLLGACGDSDVNQADRDGETAESESAAVGLVELADGRVEATGYLDFVELEGGFWAIVDSNPREGLSQDPSVIAIVVNASEVGLPASESRDTAQFVGLAARAAGERLEGASIRMSGPEMNAESLVTADSLGALDGADEK